MPQKRYWLTVTPAVALNMAVMIPIASGKCPLVECSEVLEQLLLNNMHG